MARLEKYHLNFLIRICSYSRDYYINNAPNADGTAQGGRGSVSVGSIAASTTPEPNEVDIVINEVNPSHGRMATSSELSSHWTLSTPVRRSSSLKFINKRNSPTLSAYAAPAAAPVSATSRAAYAHAMERPATSASHYRDSGLGGIADHDLDDFDVRSHRSWRSSSGYFGPATLPKRYTQSTLSLHSNASGLSFGSSASKRRGQATGPSAAVLTQFEKQLLHKDLKRNSFRAVSATSKDFVMNPLFEREVSTTKPSMEDQDSGVDSCLNGFSGADAEAKYSNNSLLF